MGTILFVVLHETTQSRSAQIKTDKPKPINWNPNSSLAAVEPKYYKTQGPNVVSQSKETTKLPVCSDVQGFVNPSRVKGRGQ